jgi:hypothetical protein
MKIARPWSMSLALNLSREVGPGFSNEGAVMRPFEQPLERHSKFPDAFLFLDDVLVAERHRRPAEGVHPEITMPTVTIPRWTSAFFIAGIGRSDAWISMVGVV